MTSIIERKGAWMQTYSGREFYPLDPRPEEIHIEDIAAAFLEELKCPDIQVGGWNPRDAERVFLRSYKHLTERKQT